jgi:hypothetical protein
MKMGRVFDLNTLLNTNHLSALESPPHLPRRVPERGTQNNPVSPVTDRTASFVLSLVQARE